MGQKKGPQDRGYAPTPPYASDEQALPLPLIINLSESVILLYARNLT